MNVTEVFTGASNVTTWFLGTTDTPVPVPTATSTSGVLAAACTLTAPTRCGIYGAAPSLQPLLIVIWLGFLLWSLFGNGCTVLEGGAHPSPSTTFYLPNRSQGTRSVACRDSNPGPLDSESRTLPLRHTTPPSHWGGLKLKGINGIILPVANERGNYFLARMTVADILLAVVHAPASISSLERGNYFLAGMAVADILLAVVHAPASISSLVSGEPMTEGWCKLQAFLSPGAFNLSMSFMTGLWYCRYRYIVHPLTYQATVTSRRIAVAMATSVAISFLPPAIYVLRHSSGGGATSLSLARPTGLTIPCNVGGLERLVNLVIDILQFGVCTFCIVRVLFEARKHRVQIANQVPAIAWAEQANAWKAQMKIVYTHLITVGVNCLTWLPILAIGSMLAAGTLILNDSVSIWLEVFWMVNQTSTFSDSVVFAFRYEIYRKALRQLVRKIRQIIEEYQTKSLREKSTASGPKIPQIIDEYQYD
ncbi:odorant binding [Branchiostoma belcheri]|nr:odorant binding [Branchiostoma belcheri]